MYVSSVAYLSVKMVPLLMKELRLGRTTMDTNNVAKNSVCRGAENKSFYLHKHFWMSFSFSSSFCIYKRIHSVQKQYLYDE